MPSAQALRRSGLTAVLLTAAIVMLFPFLWTLVTSLKSDADLASSPLSLSPAGSAFDSYRQLFSTMDVPG